MPRYIDADAYIKYCEEKWIPLNVDAVNKQPTADVVERKKGKWNDDNTCSVCGKEPLTEFDVTIMRYCPYCGAEMETE